MNDKVDFLLELLKATGYLSGILLVAARVAKYYIERDKDLKAEAATMKTDIRELKEQMEELTQTLKDYNLLNFRVKQLEDQNILMAKNYESILNLCSEIKFKLNR